MPKLSINLSEQPYASIKVELVDNLKYMGENMKVAAQNIVSTLCEKGGAKATELNAQAPNSSTVAAKVVPKSKFYNGSISLSGKSAVYDEFGTGEEGLRDPHPMKGQFGLNPYNSGPAIFYNQYANRWQWYYRPMAGRPYFTQYGATSGIPSGKQMYNTLQYIRDIKGEVISEELQDALGMNK